MEERIIKIDIKTAKEWYKKGLFKKELALLFFTKEELEEVAVWKSIKTFEDACNTVGINHNWAIQYFDEIAHKTKYSKMLIAQYKLAIIKEALNGDWKPQLNKGKIYYSWLRWYLKGKNYSKNYNKIGEFKDLTTDKVYSLVSPEENAYFKGGLGIYGDGEDDNWGSGCTNTCLNLFGFKSPEIAMHFTKYFGKIIFDALYGQYNNYKWIE